MGKGFGGSGEDGRRGSGRRGTNGENEGRIAGGMGRGSDGMVAGEGRKVVVQQTRSGCGLWHRSDPPPPAGAVAARGKGLGSPTAVGKGDDGVDSLDAQDLGLPLPPTGFWGQYRGRVERGDVEDPRPEAGQAICGERVRLARRVADARAGGRGRSSSEAAAKFLDMRHGGRRKGGETCRGALWHLERWVGFTCRPAGPLVRTQGDSGRPGPGVIFPLELSRKSAIKEIAFRSVAALEMRYIPRHPNP